MNQPVRLPEPRKETRLSIAARQSVLWSLVGTDAAGGMHAATTPALLTAIIDVADHIHDQDCLAVSW